MFRPSRSNPSLLRPVLIVALAGVCLLSGYALGVRQSTRDQAPRPTAPAQLSEADQRAFDVVWETLAQLEHDYYRPDTLDSSRLAAGAARGMVEAVGDPYTTIVDRQRSDETTAELRGTFDGVGVELDRRDGQLVVIAPLADSPAARADIRPGDAIVSVDGQALSSDTTLDQLAQQIRGPRGSSVTLSLLRDGHPLEVTVVRDTVRVQSVRSRMLGGDMPLAYVRITTFGERTGQELRDQLRPLLSEGSRGVVLDLRGNPGGYLSAAVDVTSAFVKDGVVLYQQRGPGDTSPRPYRTTGSPQAPDVPVVVLVDRGTASAAEIVAAALRENQRAVLVGEQTFGKGTVQELHQLTDDAQLKVTVARWLTPDAHAIQGQGLLPDVAAGSGDRNAGGSGDGGDPALDAATQLLRQGGGGRG
jgi:carboxyl-terminal processing protease